MSAVDQWMRLEEAQSYNRNEHMDATRNVLGYYLAERLCSKHAANSIVDIYLRASDPTRDENPLKSFWMKFSSLALFVGGDPNLATRMVFLFLAISHQSAPRNATTRITFLRDTDQAWLKGFAAAFRDVGLYVEKDWPTRRFETWIMQATPLANASAFAATLFLRGDSSLAPMAECVTSVLCRALEDDFNDIFGQREADMFMPAAAAIMRIAGKRIHELCVSEERSSASGLATGPLWHGESELNVQRWQFWKARFAHFSTTDEVGEGCRRFAAEAGLSMARAEEQRGVARPMQRT